MSNPGKARYESIPIPEELNAAIASGIRRGRRQLRLHQATRALVSAAAAFVLLFGSANIPVLYASAVQIPVLGDLVRIFHIGQGGESTDGMSLTAQSAEQSIDLIFDTGSDGSTSAPRYTVSRLRAPHRIVVRLSGIRLAERDTICENLIACDGVSRAYFSMMLDDSMIELNIELAEGFDYTITEYTTPARLTITFIPTEQTAETEEVWYLRTEAAAFGESLGHLDEQLRGITTSQVQTDDGLFILTVGEYTSQAEAEAALAQLCEKAGQTLPLTVACSPANAVPQSAG